jgi:hypothetical protein
MHSKYAAGLVMAKKIMAVFLTYLLLRSRTVQPVLKIVAGSLSLAKIFAQALLAVPKNVTDNTTVATVGNLCYYISALWLLPDYCTLTFFSTRSRRLTIGAPASLHFR